MLRKFLTTGAVALGLAVGVGQAVAQSEYPAKPIRFVAPFAPGSGSDVVARVVAQYAAAPLGQPVVVENMPGASGAIGAANVARAAPDGYTVLLGSTTTHAANQSLIKNLSYKPTADFKPVSKLGTVALALLVHPSVPAADVRELIAHAKTNPGKLTFASGSASSRVAAEMFRTMAGIDMLHVPYKSNPQALTDLMSGQTSLAFTDLAAALPFVKSGRLRALAVTTARRSPFAPDLPTMAEAGVPGYELTGWLAAYVPARTPQPVVERLNAAFRTALAGEGAVTALERAGVEATPSTPEELAAFSEAETRKWAEVVKAAGIEPE